MHVIRPGQWILAVMLLSAMLAFAGCSESSAPGAETKVVSATEAPSAPEDFYPFDTPPVLRTYPTPVYPDKARKAGLEGKVTVRVLVSAEGSVIETKVLSASDEIFVKAATTAMAKCEFEPALKDGKTTRSMVAVPVQFKLQ